MTLPTVGLVGLGTVGRHVARRAREAGFARIAFACVRDAAKAREMPQDAAVFSDPARVAEFDVDLVVEAATPEAMIAIAEPVLARRDLLAFTLTPLADAAFAERIARVCAAARTRLLVPHGAILGLDGILDGRRVLGSVTITTTKGPKSLGLPPGTDGVVFDGPAREACRRFPRNVNVHAAVALCGLGFDATRSVIVADRTSTTNRHDIAVKGEGLDWTLSLASPSLGGVTGAYTPESAAATVERLLARSCGVVLA